MKEWININNPEIHSKLFDNFGNRFNIPIVEEYQRNSNREWVLNKSNSYSESYYLLNDKLYLRFGNKLMPLATDCNNPELNVYWKLVEIKTDFKRITGKTVLFENKYRQLRRCDYSNGTCFYSLHEYLEYPYPHYADDFRVDEGADNLKELIDFMNRRLAFSHKWLNQDYIKGDAETVESIGKVMKKEKELIEFMEQLTAVSD